MNLRPTRQTAAHLPAGGRRPALRITSRAAALIAVASIGLIACGGGSESASTGSDGDDAARTTVETPRTTAAAPETTVAATVVIPVVTTPAPAVTEPPVVETEAPALVEPVRLGTFIEPPAGYEVEELPDEAVAEIAADMSMTEGITDYVSGVGAGTATDAAGTNVVIGVQLIRELTDVELNDFLNGVVDDAQATERTALGGLNGIAFQDSDGMFGFAAVVGTTAFVTLSEDLDQLAAVMNALAVANGGEGDPNAGAAIDVEAIDAMIAPPGNYSVEAMTADELATIAEILASRPEVAARVSSIGGGRLADAAGAHWLVVLAGEGLETLDDTTGPVFIEALIGDPETGVPAWEFATVGGVEGLTYIDAEGLPTFVTGAFGDNTRLMWVSSQDAAQLDAVVAAIVAANA